MLFLLVVVPVAAVIVSNVTSISALVGLQLEMDIHSVYSKSSLVNKTFLTIWALVLFLIIRCMSCSHVKFHPSDFNSTFRTSRLLYVNPNMVLEVVSIQKCFITCVTLKLFF